MIDTCPLYWGMQKFLLITIFSFVFIGCGSTLIEHQPVKIERNLALNMLSDLLQQQHKKYAPHNLEVTEKYFKTEQVQARMSMWTGNRTAVPNVSYVYFSRIGSISLYKKKSLYVVVVNNKQAGNLYHFGVPEKQVAIDFINTLESLR